jgi:hypothetical protein
VRWLGGKAAALPLRSGFEPTGEPTGFQSVELQFAILVRSLECDLRVSRFMKTSTNSTVVGVFEDRIHANQAVHELHQAGFTDKQIGIAMKHSDHQAADDYAGENTHAGSGALTGALTGLGLGALAGLGVLVGVIPVVGPAIAAGTLGVVLSNAAAGAAISGLVGALVGAGLPEHEAKYYQGEFEAGRVIVTVAAGDLATDASAILRRCGGYDMSNRTAETLTV